METTTHATLDPDRAAAIDRWAAHVRTHPDWKREHTAFINAQFEKAAAFYKRLAATEDGRKRLARLRKHRAGQSL